MSKYGEPWAIVGDDLRNEIIRSDGGLAAILPCIFGVHPRTIREHRIVDTVNACAGIQHPEKLPSMLEAVRFVLDDVTRQALGDDTLPQVMAAVNDLRRAYAAMMGETT